MTTYVMRNGELIEKEKASPLVGKAGAVQVISDTMPLTRHMADGNFYDSKKKFRDATKAAGCCEVGNETSTLLKPRQPVKLDPRARREAIHQAIHELRNKR